MASVRLQNLGGYCRQFETPGLYVHGPLFYQVHYRFHGQRAYLLYFFPVPG
jgi:hypothetical protein